MHERPVEPAASAGGDPIVQQVVAKALHHMRRVRNDPHSPEVIRGVSSIKLCLLEYCSTLIVITWLSKSN